MPKLSMRLSFLILVCLSFGVTAQTDFQRAEGLFQEERYKEAAPFFERYLKANPHHLKTKEYLGDISALAKNWDDALVYYSELLKARPDNADYNFKYGGVLGLKAKAGNRFIALTLIGDIKKHLQMAVDLDPHHIEARWAMLQLYTELPVLLGGSDATARKYAGELLQISLVDGYLAFGYISEYGQRYKEAESHYKNAIATGGSVHTFEKLADLYEAKIKLHDKAIAIRLACFKKHKDNDQNYEIGRIAAIYNVNAAEGLSYLQKFLDNHSEEDRTPLEYAYLRMAQIKRQLKQKNEAIKYIERALGINSHLQEAKEEKKMILSL